ncbi:hypothetical protein EON63_20420, partial [archaeon]
MCIGKYTYTYHTYTYTYPQCAARVEEIIRSEGAIPATIAIIQGRAYVGLSPQQIDHIGKGGAGVG